MTAFWTILHIQKVFIPFPLCHFSPVPWRTISKELYITPLRLSISSYTSGDRKALSDVGSQKCRRVPLVKYWLWLLGARVIVQHVPESALHWRAGDASAGRLLVRAERSRCHGAVFNKISPSFLDIVHDSSAASHFLANITPHIFGLMGLLLLCVWWASWSVAVNCRISATSIVALITSRYCF